MELTYTTVKYNLSYSDCIKQICQYAVTFINRTPYIGSADTEWANVGVKYLYNQLMSYFISYGLTESQVVTNLMDANNTSTDVSTKPFGNTKLRNILNDTLSVSLLTISLDAEDSSE